MILETLLLEALVAASPVDAPGHREVLHEVRERRWAAERDRIYSELMLYSNRRMTEWLLGAEVQA
jgi:hypothetical protein